MTEPQLPVFGRRKRPRRPLLNRGVRPQVQAAADSPEIARFLREQPALDAPRRAELSALPGLVALPLLGYRVVRPHEA